MKKETNNKHESVESSEEDRISRRQFLRKLGLGAAGLSALAFSPASALDIRSNELQFFNETSGGKQFEVNSSGNLDLQNNNIQGLNTVKGNITNRNNGLTQIDTNTYKSSTQPSNPVEGDLWIDTNKSEYKIYSGARWTILRDNYRVALVDDFEEQSLDEYTVGSTSDVQFVTSSYEGSYAVYRGSNDSGTTLLWFPGDGLNSYYRKGNGILRFYGNAVSVDMNYAYSFAFGAEDSNNFYYAEHKPDSNEIRIGKVISGSKNFVSTASTSTSSDTWYRNDIIWKDDDSITFELYDTSDNLLSSVSATASDVLSGEGLGPDLTRTGSKLDIAKIYSA